MKYYSELLNEIFDTEDSLHKAEDQQLGCFAKVAEAELETALKEYRNALATCKNIQTETDHKIRCILKPAAHKLVQCQQNLVQAYKDIDGGN